MEEPIYGDLHVHTSRSDGLDDPRTVVELARRKGLRVLAVTDHDTVAGGVEAARYGGRDIIVVPGVEVSSRDGHILCLGVEEEPRLKGARAEDVVEWCRSRGGVIVYAHPFGYLLRASTVPRSRIEEVARIVDAIEAINGRTFARFNAEAIRLARSLGKPMTAGSDAHVAKQVGSVRCVVRREVSSVDDVLRAVRAGQVDPLGPMPRALDVVASIVGRRIELVLRKLGVL